MVPRRQAQPQGSVGRTPLILLKPEGQDVSRPPRSKQWPREEREGSLALRAPAPLQARSPSGHALRASPRRKAVAVNETGERGPPAAGSSGRDDPTLPPALSTRWDFPEALQTPGTARLCPQGRHVHSPAITSTQAGTPAASRARPSPGKDRVQACAPASEALKPAGLSGSCSHMPCASEAAAVPVHPAGQGRHSSTRRASTGPHRADTG